MAAELEYLKDGSLVAISLWVAKDMIGAVKGMLTHGPQETHQTTTVNSNGNGATYAVSAIHVESAINRLTDAMDKVGDTMVQLTLESKEQTKLLLGIYDKSGCAGKAVR